MTVMWWPYERCVAMAVFNYTFNASGAFTENVGLNGTNDVVNVTIGPLFRGVIAINSNQGDGEIETANLFLPTGWSVTRSNSTTAGGESPPMQQESYFVFDAAGAPVGTVIFLINVINANAACFTRGTLIETEHGPKPVEDLHRGDLVVTQDHGLQPIRWIGKRTVTAADLAQYPKLTPVRITAGALQEGLPRRDLLVSRQHRMVVSPQAAKPDCRDGDVLVSAIKLTGLPGVFVDETVDEVEYFHMLFDRHQVIFAEGAPTESLFPGAQALRAVSLEARAELFQLFPELIDAGYTPDSARPIPTGRVQKELIAALASKGGGGVTYPGQMAGSVAAP